MFNNEIYLSNTDKLKDYLGLELNMNSSERVWRRAIQIFENRMQSRYFNAIDNYLKMVIKKVYLHMVFL